MDCNPLAILFEFYFVFRFGFIKSNAFKMFLLTSSFIARKIMYVPTYVSTDRKTSVTNKYGDGLSINSRISTTCNAVFCFIKKRLTTAINQSQSCFKCLTRYLVYLMQAVQLWQGRYTKIRNIFEICCFRTQL